MKKPLFVAIILTALFHDSFSQEVFSVDSINRTLTPVGQRYYLAHPFEILYGPDDSLYITEKVGKVRIVSAVTGQSRIILDHRSNTYINISYSGGVATSIGQNGMMGMALHKDFKAATPVNYVYISYAYNSSSLRISRFTYNTTTWQLGSELQLVNGIPSGNDHSSGRLIYGPDDKLYYSCGDQGNNQFNNRCNPIRSQELPTQAEITAVDYTKYQGKILRVNLDGSIPSDNPLLDPDGAGGQPAVRSHIFTMGHRNPQGLVFEMNANDGTSYPTLKSGGIFYSSEHGIRTDDEVNIISSGNNYGWPLWAGFRDNPADNYRYINWSTASGSNCSSTSYNEVVIPGGATVIQEFSFPAGTFTDPILSMYPECNGAPNCNVTLTTGTNWMQFPTVAPSSIDHYGFSNIPGWKNSLLIPTLRRGTLYRHKLDAAGTAIQGDSIPYFFRTDRYRDLAIKNGNIIFTVTDSIGSTSGPSGGGTSSLTRPGTILKYTFLGYVNSGLNKSTIPSTVDIAAGNPNSCTSGSAVTIDATNNNLWVPITGPDGNIVAEIKANGNNLGVVTTSFYKNNGAIRVRNSFHYLDRNITITPTVQPSSTVNIRFYLTNAEFTALDNDGASGINSLTDLKILKNNDACLATVSTNTTLINPTFAEAHGSAGYVLQGDITSFSSFYFGSSNITLPLDLLSFRGTLQNNTAVLQWETAHETNTSYFNVERSTDGRNFIAIGTVAATGNSTGNSRYSLIDNDVANQPSVVVYYRLKMADTDGSSGYSGTIAISLADLAGRVTIFPNPAINEIKLVIAAPADGNAQWKIMDNAGRVVLQNTTQLRKGNNSLLVNINRLSAGIYYLSVSGTGIDQKVKLQKL